MNCTGCFSKGARPNKQMRGSDALLASQGIFGEASICECIFIDSRSLHQYMHIEFFTGYVCFGRFLPVSLETIGQKQAFMCV